MTGNIDSKNCASEHIHKVKECNYTEYDIQDGYSVLLNIHKSIPVIAYRMEGKWYDNWNDTLLDVNTEDIISFFDIPVPKFFKSRRKKP